MAENRLLNFILILNGMFSRLYELGHLNILHIFSWKIAGDICMCRVYGRLL